MAYTLSVNICPHCNKSIYWKFKAGKKRIGLKFGEPEIYRCKHCGNAISNGLKEWPELTPNEKSMEKLKFFWSCFSMGLFWGVGGGVAISLFIESMRDNIAQVMIIGFLVVSFIHVIGLKALVNESVERYNKKQNQSLKDITVFDAVSLNISDEIKIIKQKLTLLSDKINVLSNNLIVISPEAKDNENVTTMVNKLKDIIEGLVTYYDNYGAIFLKLNFEQMSHYVKTRNIETINIPKIVNEISENIFKIYNELLIEIGENSQYTKYINCCFEEFKKNMIALKTHLVALQTNYIISKTSPIDEEEIAKLFKINNEQFKLNKTLSELDNEYDRYMAEIKVNKL